MRYFALALLSVLCGIAFGCGMGEASSSNQKGDAASWEVKTRGEIWQAGEFNAAGLPDGLIIERGPAGVGNTDVDIVLDGKKQGYHIRYFGHELRHVQSYKDNLPDGLEIEFLGDSVVLRKYEEGRLLGEKNLADIEWVKAE